MKFEWDEEKNQINIKKHNVSFEEASTIFEDINVIITDDFKHSNDKEERFIALGRSYKKICYLYAIV